MRSPAARMIGREAQLRDLRQALDGARRGDGGAVFLTGEAGVGKSRLAAEAAAEAFAAAMPVLRGRCTATGPAAPFRPLAEALAALLRRGEPLDGLALGPYRPVLGRLIPEWSVGDQGNSSTVILGEAVLRLLIAVGRPGGLLLLLEDLHDADPETLAVLEYLVDNLEGTPVLLLGTVRSEFCDAMDLVSAARLRGAGTVLDLAPLTRPQVAQMIDAHLGAEPGQVPAAVADRLWSDGAGSPFLVAELLQSMVGSGALVQGPDGWQTVGDLRSDVSGTLARGILRRVDRLGPQGLELLTAAAVLGPRFPLTVLQRMTGVTDRDLLSHLHAGVAAQLVMADEPAPDWYAFRSPLTLTALLTQLTPDARARVAARAADAAQELHPKPAGEWCTFVAELRLQAGEPAEAARLYLQAGRRALADGAIGSSVALLGRAERLLHSPAETAARAEVLEALLPALAEAGEFVRALDLAEHLHHLGGAELSPARVAALHTRLAKVAHTAGRWADGNRQIALARQALGPVPDEAQSAPVDVVAAYLALDTPGPDRTQLGEKLARRAVDTAERHGLFTVACQGWELLATVARERDLGEAREFLERARSTAERHRLPLQRLYALVRLGGNDWLAEGETAVLAAARDEALRLGAATVVHTIDGTLILDQVLAGEFETARRAADDCLAVVRRLRLAPTIRYTLMAAASAAAFQGDRPAMLEALDAFDACDGVGSQEEVLTVGLARVFCALVEEDRALAVRELRAVARLERDNPSTYFLSGRHGVGVLLDVLSGRAGRAEHRVAAATAPGRMRWNRQFLALADAVLCGREGDPDGAEAAVACALREAESYPVARALGLRLVAEPAHRDGWGEPVAWLRQAEHFFHQLGNAALANACRAALRGMGAPVHQHRSGTDRIPDQLRARGVTVREYEVFLVLADRLGNKDIADRLFISPRTVEKHISALITKAGVVNRAALCALAASMRG